MTTENKRDLAADLAICEAAAPAFILHQGVYAVPTGGTTIETEICRDDYEPLNGSDTEFILEAREGWPEAIRRAMVAEAEVADLKKSKRLIQMAYDSQYARATDYYREMKRLEAVLERIAGATMSQYATIDDMVRGIKRMAKEALDYGGETAQENNGR